MANLNDVIKALDETIRLVNEVTCLIREAREVLAAPPAHCKDSDCTLDPETQECVICHVWHGAPCVDCGQRGYHKNLCASAEVRFSPVRSRGIHAV